MRFAGFSLVGILVVVGILMLINNFYTAPMLQQAGKTIPQAQQLSGRGTGTGLKPGMPFTESFTYTEAGSGRFRGLKIVTVVPGGPLNDFYGALPGDVVLGIVGRGDWETLSTTDADTAAAHLQQLGYQASMSIDVDRPGVGKIELPRDAAMLPPGMTSAQFTPAPAAGTPPTAAPPAPTPGPPAGSTPPTRRPTVWDRIEDAGKPVESH